MVAVFASAQFDAVQHLQLFGVTVTPPVAGFFTRAPASLANGILVVATNINTWILNITHG